MDRAVDARTGTPPESGRPAFKKPGVYTNYAVGRARARPDAAEFAFYDLGAQVTTFLVDFGGPRARQIHLRHLDRLE